MCTILTCDRQSYENNKDEIIETIVRNQWMNEDGCSLILKGKDKEMAIIKSINEDVILAALDGDSSWKRFWLHQRLATTNKVTIEQTHAFAAHPWYVMHNGMLNSTGAKLLDVDSRFIADVIKSRGVKYALHYLNNEEFYANVFLVNIDTGEFYVSRQTGGTLYASADAMIFSTTQMYCASYKVPRNFQSKFGINDPQELTKATPEPMHEYSAYGSFGMGHGGSSYTKSLPPKSTTTTETAKKPKAYSAKPTTVVPAVQSSSNLMYYEFSYESSKFEFFTETSAEEFYQRNHYYPDPLTTDIYTQCIAFNLLDTKNKTEPAVGYGS